MTTESDEASPPVSEDASAPSESPPPAPAQGGSTAEGTPRTGASKASTLAQRLPVALCVLVVSVCFGLSFGLNYGVDNQAVYMLGGLSKLDGSLFAKDWYTQQPNYHPAFAYLSWLLLALDRGGRFVGAGLVAVAALGTASLYGIAAELFPKKRLQALATFLLVVSVMFVTRTRSVAVSYVFDFILQPSAVASMFLLASLPPFLSGRFLLSGVFLGLSGLFHANYLILGIGTFGLAHLLLGGKDLKKRLLHQLGPSAGVFLLLSPVLFRSLGGSKETALLAQDILFNIRAPHHYSPRTFRGAFFSVAGYQMLGLGAGAFLLRGLDGAGRRFGVLVASLMALVWGGTALTTWTFIPRIAQLFVWRFAPFLDLLMILLLCAAAVRLALEPTLARRVGLSRLALSLGGLVAVGMLDSPAKEHGGVLGALLLVVAPVALALAMWGGASALARVGAKLPAVGDFMRRRGGWVIAAYAAAACFYMGSPQIAAYRVRSNLLSSSTGPEADLYRWARTNAPKDAVFLTPPQLEGFRLHGERAIVVDWKASGITPEELVKWYRRLEDVSGRKGFRRGEDAFEGYAALDAKRLGELREKYPFDYVIVGRTREQGLPGKVAYQNARYVVLDLR